MINSALKSDCDVDFLSVYFNIKFFSLTVTINSVTNGKVLKILTRMIEKLTP